MNHDQRVVRMAAGETINIDFEIQVQDIVVIVEDLVFVQSFEYFPIVDISKNGVIGLYFPLPLNQVVSDIF